MTDDAIDVGLDFGGRQFRASYRLGEHIISVPAPNSENAWFPPMITIPHPNGGIAMSVLKLLLYSDQFIQYGPKTRQQKPQALLMEILEQVYASIESYAGYDIGRLFITTPDWYPASGRERYKMAAQAAGFREIHFISECQAAVLGYLEDYPEERQTKIFVYSLGFTGFEAQIIEIGADQGMTVLAQHGQNVHERRRPPVFSGRDLDLALLQVVLKTVHQFGLHLDVPTVQEHFAILHRMVEQAKMALAIDPNVAVQFPPDLMPEDEERAVIMQFPRLVLDRVLYPRIIEPSMDVVQQLLYEANIFPDDIHHVLLVGGTTRIPAIQDNLRQFFGDKLIQPREDIIARGAASVELFSSRQQIDVNTLLSAERPERSVDAAPEVPLDMDNETLNLTSLDDDLDFYDGPYTGVERLNGSAPLDAEAIYRIDSDELETPYITDVDDSASNTVSQDDLEDRYTSSTPNASADVFPDAPKDKPQQADQPDEGDFFSVEPLQRRAEFDEKASLKDKTKDQPSPRKQALAPVDTTHLDRFLEEVREVIRQKQYSQAEEMLRLAKEKLELLQRQLGQTMENNNNVDGQ